MDGVIQNEAYKVHDDLIYYKSIIFLVPGSELKRRILEAAHNAPMVGRPDFLKTCRKVRDRFTWKGLKEDVLRHVRECIACQ